MLSIRAAARTSARIAMPSSRLGAGVTINTTSRARTSTASFSTAILRNGGGFTNTRAPSSPCSSQMLKAASFSPRLAMLSSPFSTVGAVAAAAAKGAAAANTATTGGEIDVELSAKLQSELTFEDEMSEQANMPASIKDFLANSPFQLVDREGSQEVKLVRNFGDEKITVSFSIVETPVEEPYDEDGSFGDEDESGLSATSPGGAELESPQHGSGSGASKKGSSSAAAAEGSEEEEFGEEGGEDETDLGAAPPVHFTVTIEKPGRTPAVLTAECTAQDGEVVVDDVHRHASAADAFATDAEAAHRRADRYAGPSFPTLDEDLQVLVENYLEERGVTAGLAVFMPDYVDFKEQKEYAAWLKDVKAFVDA